MRRKLAVCIGINDYPGTGADLNGCVNDARDWTSLLVGEGYAVSTLTDAAATKSAVLSNLQWLIDTARFGDRLVLTFSGHGSWIPDRGGDEPDGRDEVLVLHDWASGGFLTDDEINSVFNRRRWGVRLVIMSDSCHSGTVSRAFGTHSPHAKRFLPPAIFLDEATLARAAALDPTIPPGKPRPTAALLAGCADLEYSYDAWIGGRYRGAFTAAAMATFARGQSLAKWFGRIRTLLPNSTFPQTPQLTATSSQRRWSL